MAAEKIYIFIETKEEFDAVIKKLKKIGYKESKIGSFYRLESRLDRPGSGDDCMYIYYDPVEKLIFSNTNKKSLVTPETSWKIEDVKEFLGRDYPEQYSVENLLDLLDHLEDKYNGK